MINILSMKITKILAVLVLIMIIGVFTIPHMINLDRYSRIIAKEIQSATGHKVSIKGKASISISSEIQITIPDFIMMSNDKENSKTFIHAENIILTSSIYNFIFGKKIFHTAELNNAIISNSEVSDVTLLNKHFNLKLFTINNAHIYDKTGLNYSTLNIDINFESNGALVVSGKFLTKEREFNISANISEYKSNSSRMLKLDLSSAGAKASFNANLQDISNKLSVTGSLKAKIDDPSLLTGYFANTMPFIISMKKTHIKDSIHILSDISYNDGYVEANNFKITSGNTSGDGKIGFSLVDNLNLKVNFNFNSIDLNKFLSFKKEDADQMSFSEDSIDDDSYVSLDFVQDNDVFVNIVAEELIIHKAALKKFDFNIDIKNKDVKSGSLGFYITNGDDKSTFNVSDVSFQKVGSTNVLLGEFSGNGNNINDTLELFNLQDSFAIAEKNLNYNLKSKLIVSSSEISLFNIIGAIGQKNGQVVGNVTAQLSQIENYNINLKFAHIKLDDFELPLFKSRLQSLLHGSEKDDYLSNFIWFRTLPSAYSVKLIFTDTEFKDEKIDNLTILCNLTPDNMKLKGLIKSSFADANYSMDLEALSIKPSIKVKVSGDHLDYNIFTSLLSNIVQPGSIDKSDDLDAPQSVWSSKELDLFRIDKYTASFEFDIKNIKFYDDIMTNLRLYSHTAGKILYIDNLDFEIYKGHILSTGNISFFDRLLYQFSISGSNIETKNLFASNMPEIDVFSGPISFTSSFIAEGNSPKEIVANLNVSSNFASSGMVLSGLDSDTVVDIALQRKKIPKDKILSSTEKALIQGTTNITGLSGRAKGEKGIVQSNDITFKTRFNSAISAFSLDLNNLTISSHTQLMFMPYEGNSPVSYNIMIRGELKKPLQHKIEDKDLVEYLKSTYDIVTEADIIAARKARKEKKKKKINPIEELDNKNYLYYKLLEQDSNQKAQ